MTNTILTIEEITCTDITVDMEKNGLTTAKYFGKFSHPDHSNNCNYDVAMYEVDGTLVIATNGGTIWDNGGPEFSEIIAEYEIEL